MMRCLSLLTMPLLLFTFAGCSLGNDSRKKDNGSGGGGGSPTLDGVEIFPADSPWNQDISGLPVRSDSDSIIAVIGANTAIHFDFGSNLSYGIPFTTVDSAQQSVPINITVYPGESDPGPYPIPSDAPVESGSDGHVIVVDIDNAMLYEMYQAFYEGPGWRCSGGAVWDLTQNDTRASGKTWNSPTEKGPLNGWTSVDAAGLPVFPGLVRYDEVDSGEVKHAFRMTIESSSPGFVYPACHDAPTYPSAGHAVMGMRIRLKAGFDVSNHPPEIQVMLNAMKKYGLVVADNGSNWYISGVADTRWNDNNLTDVQGGSLAVRGSDFEVVYTGDIQQ